MSPRGYSNFPQAWLSLGVSFKASETLHYPFILVTVSDRATLQYHILPAGVTV